MQHCQHKLCMSSALHLFFYIANDLTSKAKAPWYLYVRLIKRLCVENKRFYLEIVKHNCRYGFLSVCWGICQFVSCLSHLTLKNSNILM